MSETAAPQTDSAVTGRIAARFQELSKRGEMGLVAYITAGDPSLQASEGIARAAANAGADVIELGVPFSDPVADGPTIQRASERALRAGATLGGVLDLVRKIRKHSDVPLVLFSYYNPLLQMGIEKFARAAAEVGADGILATDLTLEEAGDYRARMRAHNLDTIFLAAPTSTDTRIEQIAKASSGFLYLISRTGVTGARKALPEELPMLIGRARRFTALPIAVGFGISLPAHVTALGGMADAAVVGSALMTEIEKAQTPEAAAAAVGERIRVLKESTRRPGAPRESASNA